MDIALLSSEIQGRCPVWGLENFSFFLFQEAWKKFRCQKDHHKPNQVPSLDKVTVWNETLSESHGDAYSVANAPKTSIRDAVKALQPGSSKSRDSEDECEILELVSATPAFEQMKPDIEVETKLVAHTGTIASASNPVPVPAAVSTSLSMLPQSKPEHEKVTSSNSHDSVQMRSETAAVQTATPRTEGNNSDLGQPVAFLPPDVGDQVKNMSHNGNNNNNTNGKSLPVTASLAWRTENAFIIKNSYASDNAETVGTSDVNPRPKTATTLAKADPTSRRPKTSQGISGNGNEVSTSPSTGRQLPTVPGAFNSSPTTNKKVKMPRLQSKDQSRSGAVESIVKNSHATTL